MIPLGSLQLEIGTMLVQLIIFLVLLWLVRKFAMKPAMKVLNDRQSYIQTQISGAEEANKEATRLMEEQKRLMADARKEAHELLEKARQQKDREAEQITKAAHEHAGNMIKDATAEILNEKNKAIAALRSEVSAMSVLIASKIIEKQIDEKSQRELIEHYLNQAGGK